LCGGSQSSCDSPLEFPVADEEPNLKRLDGIATVRRYEGIDQTRTDELVKKVGESLLPRLSEMPGFKSYYLIEADKGVMSSVGFFDTSAQADESSRVAATFEPSRLSE
jgi:hypothetical protein